MSEIIHKRGDNVPDYKKMYLEIYISAPETEITVLPVTEGDHER